MGLGICEKIWLQKVLSDLHKDGELPMKIFCENKATVSIANERVQYDRTKHGDFVKHSIKKKLDKCSI